MSVGKTYLPHYAPHERPDCSGARLAYERPKWRCLACGHLWRHHENVLEVACPRCGGVGGHVTLNHPVWRKWVARAPRSWAFGGSISDDSIDEPDRAWWAR